MFDPIKIYRLSNVMHNKELCLFARILRDINFFLFNTYLPPSCQIGRGTLLGYKGMGTVIHPGSVVGRNCVIGHGVTLGTALPYSTNKPSPGPRVGDNTFIGAGAKLLGNIEVGSNCTIAAGAIVLQNFPDNSIIVGIPGRHIGTNDTGYRAIIQVLE